MKQTRTALSIAGFDPTSGAGLTADIRVFHSFRVHGIGVISSLTAQNSMGVVQIDPVSRSFIKRQLRTLLDDITPNATKAGMLYDKGAIKVLCSEISCGRIRRLVIDPVMTSSSGKRLIKKDALNELIDELIPRCMVVTPNIHEAQVLTGMNISGIEDMYGAAEKILALGVENVVVTGGHLKDNAVDVFYNGHKFRELRSKKRQGWYHGTGCAFSAALTASLAKGKTVNESVTRAKTYMQKALEKSIKVGKGMNLLHF